MDPKIEKRLQSHQSKGHCFKSCGKEIVVLGKTPDTVTNEERSGVTDKDHAPFRGSVFVVVDIVHKFEPERTTEEVRNTIWDRSIATYRKGEIVYPDRYDSNENIICSNGIHYFLTYKTAYFNEIYHQVTTMKHNTWYDNGNKKETFYHKDGMLDGKYVTWHKNGNKWKTCHYKVGVLDGKYRTWHINGNKWITCHYKDGELCGEYHTWYDNGDKYEIYNCEDCEFDDMLQYASEWQ